MPPRVPKIEAVQSPDTIEYGMTVGIKDKGVDYWIKVGVTSQVRPGESSRVAMDRIVEFVGTELQEKAEQIQGN